MNDALIKAGMDKLFALAQEGKDDYTRAGNYSMLIGVYETTIKMLLSDKRYNEELVLQDLESATRFFQK